jgi:hypothetical protein
MMKSLASRTRSATPDSFLHRRTDCMSVIHIAQFKERLNDIVFEISFECLVV